jgi:hypothetical protein
MPKKSKAELALEKLLTVAEDNVTTTREAINKLGALHDEQVKHRDQIAHALDELKVKKEEITKAEEEN